MKMVPGPHLALWSLMSGDLTPMCSVCLKVNLCNYRLYTSVCACLKAEREVEGIPGVPMHFAISRLKITAA